MKHCPFCNTDYKQKLSSCPNCGAAESQAKCEALSADPIPPALRTRKGAAIATGVFVVLGLCLLLLPIAKRGGTAQPRPAVTAADKIQQNEGVFGALEDTYLKIVSARRGTDSAGDAAVIITFKWTNNTQWERAAMTGVIPSVYQNGVKLVEDTRSERNVTKPGASQTLRRTYRLAEENAPVYVECTGGSADEHMVVRLFEALEED